MISNRVLWKWRAKTLSKQWTCSLNLCAADAPMLCCNAVKHQRCCHWGDRAVLLPIALRLCKSIPTVAGPTGACHNPQDVAWITHLEKAHTSVTPEQIRGFRSQMDHDLCLQVWVPAHASLPSRVVMEDTNSTLDFRMQVFWKVGW